jgi:hypothetical protein
MSTDKRISELPYRAIAGRDDLIPTVADGVNYQMPLSALDGVVGGSLVPEIVGGASYTAASGDETKIKVMTNAAGALVTLPSGVFTIPTVLNFEQGATGAVKIIGASGVTVAAPQGLLPISAGQGHTLYALLLAPNSFMILGGLRNPRLDAILQLAVVSRDLQAPPGAVVEGDRYIPKGVASGAWAGKENQIAHFTDGAWRFYAPGKGWLCGIDDEDIAVRYNGANWVSIYQPEKGVWTPTLIGQTAGSATLAIAEGGYVRSGAHIHTHCHIVTSSTVGLSGQLAISNLPFPPSTLPGVAGRTGGIIPFWQGFTFAAGFAGLWSWMQDEDRFRLYRAVINSGGESVTEAHISGTITLYCTHAYVMV